MSFANHFIVRKVFTNYNVRVLPETIGLKIVEIIYGKNGDFDRVHRHNLVTIETSTKKSIITNYYNRLYI